MPTLRSLAPSTWGRIGLVAMVGITVVVLIVQPFGSDGQSTTVPHHPLPTRFGPKCLVRASEGLA